MAIGAGPASRRNRLIRIEQPASATGFTSAGKATWTLVAEVYAEVLDMLPSRGERQSEGFNIATRPARVRIGYRTDIAAKMRVLVGQYVKVDGQREWQTLRTAQIVTVPAEMGVRAGLEFMIEDYTSAGNAA